MTLESTMRSNVLEILRKEGLDARPVENPIDPGFPDVEYIGGVIELKACSGWPARASTPLRIDHYSWEQRIWQSRRWRKGGTVFVLIQVGSEFLLFTGNVASEVLGLVPQAELRTHARHQFASLSELRRDLAPALREYAQ